MKMKKKVEFIQLGAPFLPLEQDSHSAWCKQTESGFKDKTRNLKKDDMLRKKGNKT
jgi:hypothetical protein